MEAASHLAVEYEQEVLGLEDVTARLQAGVAALTDALSERTLATLAKSDRIQQSVEQLETSLNHSIIDLQTLTHSSFVETTAHDPDLRAIRGVVETDTSQAKQTPFSDQPPREGDPLDGFLSHLAHETVSSSLNLPHVYGTEAFLQDADVGINKWHGKEAVSMVEDEGNPAELGGWTAPDFHRVMTQAMEEDLLKEVKAATSNKQRGGTS